MKQLIKHARAKVRGRNGQKTHRQIVDNVFATRDALDRAADNMLVEMEANTARVGELLSRNKELSRTRKHASDVAARIAEFFVPR